MWKPPAREVFCCMASNQKENLSKNILPWIRDDSYKSEEWQREIEEKMIEIREVAFPPEKESCLSK